MKRYTIGLITLLLIVGCSKPINDETLIEKDGLKYHPDTKELYTGKTTKNILGGTKEFEGSYEDGKKDGLWTYWDHKGQKSKEETFKNGKEDGLWAYWDHKGQKSREETWKAPSGSWGP
ncbi:uncharacterized protein METZ01_LOCUS360510, partial [marine metagenome]